MKRLFNLSFFYLILGLALGVFFREFTKLNDFSGATTLNVAHTHTLVLGFIFFLVIVILEKVFTISNIKYFNIWLITYNIGLLSLISTLVARGILEILNKDFAGLPHIAGTSHAILGLSLIWLMIILKKSIFTNK
ncbi:DUF2871 domain-containing protein [Clostridium cuniculi]|mgnify:FL=1|uniref:DUF2871 domain-containing protein n=1 Tax=Clostridium cuniculi TaxID=2548455 RepID=UPI00105582CA|nr:DUF2871 domain-containing protein [Clostridium cuniculi]